MFKEKPIIFNGDMIKALIEGRKTQTRRLIKGNPNFVQWNPVVKAGRGGWVDEHWSPIQCKYKIGDILWVQEKFRYTEWDADGFGNGVLYFQEAPHELPAPTNLKELSERWRSPIFLPKELSRIRLQVTNVRAERLQDISEKDAIAEGMGEKMHMDNLGNTWATYSRAFESYWDSLQIKDRFNNSYDWYSNPWVWVIEFKVLNDLKMSKKQANSSVTDLIEGGK